MTLETVVIPETRPDDMPDIMAIPETDLEAMPQTQTPEILWPVVVTNNRFQTLQKTPDTTPETIDSSTPNINDIVTNNELIPLDQQQREAKTLATRLHKRSFIDTGCLINATKTEEERLLALAMYYCLGKYDPSDKYTQTYRNRTIINIYQKFTEEKITKTNTLLEIYQYIYIYIYNINKRVEYNKKHKSKPHNQIIDI